MLRRCLSYALLIAATASGVFGCGSTGGSDTEKVPDVVGKSSGAEAISAVNLTASFRGSRPSRRRP